MEKRAVLYARVSGDDRGNDGRNLRGQLEMCHQYALEHGWSIVAELAEDDREQVERLLSCPSLGRYSKWLNLETLISWLCVSWTG